MLHALQTILDADVFVVLLASVAGYATFLFARKGMSSFGRGSPFMFTVVMMAFIDLQIRWWGQDVVPRLDGMHGGFFLGVSGFLISNYYYWRTTWFLLKPVIEDCFRQIK